MSQISGRAQSSDGECCYPDQSRRQGSDLMKPSKALHERKGGRQWLSPANIDFASALSFLSEPAPSSPATSLPPLPSGRSMSAGPSQPGAMSQSQPRSQALPTQNTPSRSSFRGSLGGITPHSAGRLRGDLGSVSRLQRSMSYGPSQTVGQSAHTASIMTLSHLILQYCLLLFSKYFLGSPVCPAAKQPFLHALRVRQVFYL